MSMILTGSCFLSTKSVTNNTKGRFYLPQREQVMKK